MFLSALCLFQLHLVEFTEENNELVCEQVYSHPQEIWSLSPCPYDPALVFTVYNKGVFHFLALCSFLYPTCLPCVFVNGVQVVGLALRCGEWRVLAPTRAVTIRAPRTHPILLEDMAVMIPVRLQSLSGCLICPTKRPGFGSFKKYYGTQTRRRAVGPPPVT
jgi:hypothetical protein